MTRQLVFMDWKTQYYKNVQPTQSDLQIQYNAYQYPNGILGRNRKHNLKICVDHKRYQIVKAILSKKNKGRGIILPDLKNIFHNYSNQSKVVLA